MIKENFDTIIGIQKKNPYAKAARKRFVENAGDISGMDDYSLRLLKEVMKK